MNIQQRSHFPVDIKSTQTLIPLPNRTRVVSVRACVCGRVGFGWQRSRRGSHQVMACLPSEDEGRENKQKDEEGTQRALVDRGRNKSFFWMFI